MKNRSISSTPPEPLRQHQRTRDILRIVGLLNVWAMAPAMDDRSKALRDALRAYRSAVSDGRYPSIKEDVCSPSEACYVARTGSFEDHFGSPEGDSTALPWED